VSEASHTALIEPNARQPALSVQVERVDPSQQV